MVATVEEVRLVYQDRLVARHPRCWQRHRHALSRSTIWRYWNASRVVSITLGPWSNGNCLSALASSDVGLKLPIPATARGLTSGYCGSWSGSLCQLTGAVEYALDIDVIDPESIRTIIEHRAEQPVALFSLDGRPHLAQVRVEMTDVAAYGALLTEVSP